MGSSSRSGSAPSTMTMRVLVVVAVCAAGVAASHRPTTMNAERTPRWVENGVPAADARVSADEVDRLLREGRISTAPSTASRRYAGTTPPS